MAQVTENLTGIDLGEYKLLDLVAGGGMAVVYLGVKKNVTLQNKHDAEPRAIKVLKRSLANADPTYKDRFFREMQTVKSLLSLPYIVRVYDFGIHGDYYYTVMEYYEGGTLAERASQMGGRIPLEEMVRILKYIAQALDAVHESDMIHRDIKPSNILFDSKNRAILADFGIAKVSGETPLTQVHNVIGTTAYLAPELLNGEEATPASDLYALGVMTYDLLEGLPPQRDTSSIGKLIDWHRSSKPFLTTVPMPVAQIVSRMIHPDPAYRYPTAMTFVQALEDAMKQAAPLPPVPSDTKSFSLEDADTEIQTTPTDLQEPAPRWVMNFMEKILGRKSK